MTGKPSDREGWAAPAATFGGALIGAIATIIAAFIAKQSGAINISLSPTAPTVTVTAAAPTVTVTAPPVSAAAASSSSGGIAGISCPANNNCKTYDLIAEYPTGVGIERAGITVKTGSVNINGNTDDLFYQASNDGSPEIIADFARAFSLNVTAQNASMQQCISATNGDPDPQPITKFYRGMLFCVTPNGGGVALMEQTEPLDSSNKLHLREIYWPAP